MAAHNPPRGQLHSFCSYSSGLGSQTSLQPPAQTISNAPVSEYMYGLHTLPRQHVGAYNTGGEREEDPQDCPWSPLQPEGVWREGPWGASGHPSTSTWAGGRSMDVRQQPLPQAGGTGPRPEKLHVSRPRCS
ncbi:Protein tweety-like protein 2 [Plecturocebus cupreus]